MTIPDVAILGRGSASRRDPQWPVATGGTPLLDPNPMLATSAIVTSRTDS
jgi:hypothetical protein